MDGLELKGCSKVWRGIPGRSSCITLSGISPIGNKGECGSIPR